MLVFPDVIFFLSLLRAGVPATVQWSAAGHL